jgi:catechol 2,3-dioxygenase-like lactoylglutathione lyase family enzyme
MAEDTAREVQGIHHLKFACSDVHKSLEFYEKAFDAKRIPQADHVDADGNVYAFICEMPGWGTLLDLRQSDFHAEGSRRFDPITLNITDRKQLARWAEHFDAMGAENSGEIPTGLAFMLIVKDPDGRRIRLYTAEKRPPEIESQRGCDWMLHDVEV